MHACPPERAASALTDSLCFVSSARYRYSLHCSQCEAVNYTFQVWPRAHCIKISTMILDIPYHRGRSCSHMRELKSTRNTPQQDQAPQSATCPPWALAAQQRPGGCRKQADAAAYSINLLEARDESMQAVAWLLSLIANYQGREAASQ